MIAAALTTNVRADQVTKLRLDFASYNPVSFVIKDKGLMEAEFAKDNIAIEWVPNMALERLGQRRAA